MTRHWKQPFLPPFAKSAPARASLAIALGETSDHAPEEAHRRWKPAKTTPTKVIKGLRWNPLEDSHKIGRSKLLQSSMSNASSLLPYSLIAVRITRSLATPDDGSHRKQKRLKHKQAIKFKSTKFCRKGVSTTNMNPFFVDTRYVYIYHSLRPIAMTCHDNKESLTGALIFRLSLEILKTK